MTDACPILAAEGLTCVAGGRTVIEDVTVTVRSGERVVLLGPSGSGKTTLLTTLAGLLTPARGRILVGGVPLTENPELPRRLAIVHQGYGLVSLLTAAENVEVALRAAGRAPADANREAAAALDRTGLGHVAGHLVEELSGGQQQRVAVARGIALARPDGALLADEPTAEQDADHRATILRELYAVAARGTALIIATHDQEVADGCDRVIRIAGAVTR